MRAAVFGEQGGDVKVREFPTPTEPGPGQVVVRMVSAAICGSDLHVFHDGIPISECIGAPGYPGHEGVGHVVVSECSRFAPGDLVLTVPSSNPSGGTFAEYLLTDGDALVPLPTTGNASHLLMAQQLGTVIYGLKRIWPPIGNTGGDRLAVVIGVGSAGLHFVQLLKHRGFDQIVVSDVVENRLVTAVALGADVGVDVAKESLIDAVMNRADGIGADLVIETAGSDETRAQAIEAVRRRGTVGYFGWPASSPEYRHSTFDAFRKEVRMQWTNGAQSEPGLSSFHEAVQLIDDGMIDVSHLIGPTFKLADIAKAMRLATERTHIKVALDLSSP